MKRFGSIFSTGILIGIIIVLCVFSAEARNGALDGVKLCETVILPSLLPLLIISSLIMKSRCRGVIEAAFGRIFEKAFRLPRCAAGAIILGLAGGYPTGAVLTNDLYKRGLIDGKNAKRIMSFNFCGGFAFIISAVGGVVYKNPKTGLILYLSNVISSLIIMAVTTPGKRKIEKKESVSSFLSIADALPEAVEASVKALAFLSAYIIVFSALCEIINPPKALMPLIEITSGLCKGDAPLPLDYCAFFLSFGGLCIHFQLIGFLKEMKIKYLWFLTSRAAGALISFFTIRLYYYIFPREAEVFASSINSSYEFTNGSLTLSLLMIIGCAVIIFDIENRKLKLI